MSKFEGKLKSSKDILFAFCFLNTITTMTKVKLEKISMAVIKNKVGKVLIIERSRPERGSDDTKLVWAFPGGRLENGEKPEEAAVRESLDETGYIISSKGLISERDHPQFPFHIYYFDCELVPGPSKVAWEIHEINGCKWINPADLKKYFSTSLDPGVAKHLGI